MGIEDTLNEQQLRDMVRSLLWQYRLVDAFWFLGVENDYGLSTAEDLNARVWGKVGKLAAKDILHRFSLSERGLRGFVQAMEYYPWKMLNSFEVEEKDDEVRIWSAQCPAQLGRLKHGLGEYACKEMHRQEFEAFAQVIDPRIRVKCLFAPPDPHPEDMFCSWRLFLCETEEGGSVSDTGRDIKDERKKEC